jgi:hypothetical protein
VSGAVASVDAESKSPAWPSGVGASAAAAASVPRLSRGAYYHDNNKGFRVYPGDDATVLFFKINCDRDAAQVLNGNVNN